MSSFLVPPPLTPTSGDHAPKRKFLSVSVCALENEVVGGKGEDSKRIKVIQSYLEQCYLAIEEGVKLKGYFAWSFMDNFEWACGFTKRFGLNHVDFSTGKPTPKESTNWFSAVIKRNGL